MDKENLDYLKNIAERISDYDDIRAYVLDYILDREIKDMELATNLFVVGFLWNASQRDEVLTPEDLTMFLGAEDDYIDSSDFDADSFILADDEASMTLTGLLNLTVKNFSVDE